MSQENIISRAPPISELSRYKSFLIPEGKETEVYRNMTEFVDTPHRTTQWLYPRLPTKVSIKEDIDFYNKNPDRWSEDKDRRRTMYRESIIRRLDYLYDRIETAAVELQERELKFHFRIEPAILKEYHKFQNDSSRMRASKKEITHYIRDSVRGMKVWFNEYQLVSDNIGRWFYDEFEGCEDFMELKGFTLRMWDVYNDWRREVAACHGAIEKYLKNLDSLEADLMWHPGMKELKVLEKDERRVWKGMEIVLID